MTTPTTITLGTVPASFSIASHVSANAHRYAIHRAWVEIRVDEPIGPDTLESNKLVHGRKRLPRGRYAYLCATDGRRAIQHRLSSKALPQSLDGTLQALEHSTQAGRDRVCFTLHAKDMDSSFKGIKGGARTLTLTLPAEGTGLGQSVGASIKDPIRDVQDFDRDALTTVEVRPESGPMLTLDALYTHPDSLPQIAPVIPDEDDADYAGAVNARYVVDACKALLPTSSGDALDVAQFLPGSNGKPWVIRTATTQAVVMPINLNGDASHDRSVRPEELKEALREICKLKEALKAAGIPEPV